MYRNIFHNKRSVFLRNVAISSDGAKLLKQEKKLVARGVPQQHGFQYKEPFAPAVKY